MGLLKIIKKEKNQNRIKVFDIAVENSYHYIMENGVVSHNSYVPTKTMGGGKGPMFAASIVVYLAKSKMRDEADKKDVIGTTLTSMLQKGRFTKEFTKCEFDLVFASGLKRYSGLLELGLKYELITKDGNSYILPNKEKVTKRKLESEPEKYYTQEVLEALEPAANAAFAFGTGLPSDEIGEIENGY